MEISKDTPIYIILQTYPDSADVFLRYGMGCSSCLGAMTESIEDSCKMHGVIMQDLLNELIRLKES